MSTIVDVCKLAGVSKTTVSRVINGTGQVKKSTQDAVQAAMDELGYRPNSLAQALARNETNSIGLVISDFQGSYFSTLLKQASASADQANKELIVTDGHNDATREYEAILRLEDNRCDSIILYSRKMSLEQLKKLKRHLTVPLVLINREFTEPLFHTVSFNQSEAMQVMMEHLISKGHRQIACITGPLNRKSNQDRLASYMSALDKYAISYNPNLVTSGNYELQDGYDACQQLLKSKQSFSMLLAFNDYMALGALKALTEVGIRVPEQVSIAGFDNNPMTRFANPSISTIDLPIRAMTKRAVETAIKLAIGETCPLSYQFNGTLIERDSILSLDSK